MNERPPVATPPNEPPAGEVRRPTTATFDVFEEGRDDTVCTAADVGPGRLTGFARGPDGAGRPCRFHFVRTNRPWHLLCCWAAASFDRSLPVAERDVTRPDERSILIEPPWPLDFRVRLRVADDANAERIVRTLKRPAPHA